jgi:hypothetical protein
MILLWLLLLSLLLSLLLLLLVTIPSYVDNLVPLMLLASGDVTDVAERLSRR